MWIRCVLKVFRTVHPRYVFLITPSSACEARICIVDFSNTFLTFNTNTSIEPSNTSIRLSRPQAGFTFQHFKSLKLESFATNSWRLERTRDLTSIPTTEDTAVWSAITKQKINGGKSRCCILGYIVYSKVNINYHKLFI